MPKTIDITRDIFPPMTAGSIAKGRELSAAPKASSKKLACAHVDRFLEILDCVTITDPHHKKLLAHVYAARIDFENVKQWSDVRDTARELCTAYTSQRGGNSEARARILLAAREAVPFT
ncbi:hypothetical protein [Rhizobium laguerreae]|uniref:hypothetical protein n=1 Tax=Rhizobium laguerreae TaxID=1076926 RepID=UPI001C90C181|nr:hypothetical protein [Rhizobium laguerreae]MBY3314700.1 hypothetical protein [Rhizobium laguerreae]